MTAAGDIQEDLTCQSIYDRTAPRTRPASASALSFGSETVSVSSIRPVEGGVELRAYEVLGKESSVTCSVAGGGVGSEVDLTGQAHGEAQSTFTFSPREIKSIRIETRKYENELLGGLNG